MSKGIVLSLYDFTGEALKPWAEAGYTCYAFDIQHPKEGRVDHGICYQNADLQDQDTLNAIQSEFGDKPVVFGMAFPVCTDMAVSGAAHFKRKAEVNPFFQADAVGHATAVARMFNGMAIPYFIENPVSVLATMWRKPDYSFHPYEYGGYIPYSEADHPRWPEYIAPFDAYKKKTCLWTGGGFVMPDKVAVDCEGYHGNGYSTAMMKLGGKSQRTKDIRSATPRGFATAVYQSNKGEN
tara:strand:+ start:424 stop:1137 length:714 start_codon:yes stop_codon:yes gene_type:complete